jgi:hypothetical protein
VGEFPTTDDPSVIRRATRLAIETNHHLFDTLYHAVALEHEDAMLVTSDGWYYGRAERYGTIAALRGWGAPQSLKASSRNVFLIFRKH